MSKTELLVFPPKSVPPTAWTSQLVTLHPSSLSIQMTWSYPQLINLYPTSSVLANSIGSTFRIHPKKTTFHHLHSFHCYVSHQHLLPGLLPSLLYLHLWFGSSPHLSPGQFSRVDNVFLVRAKAEHVNLLYTPFSMSQCPDKALQSLSLTCPSISSLASLLPHSISSTQTSLLFFSNTGHAVSLGCLDRIFSLPGTLYCQVLAWLVPLGLYIFAQMLPTPGSLPWPPYLNCNLLFLFWYSETLLFYISVYVYIYYAFSISPAKM